MEYVPEASERCECIFDVIDRVRFFDDTRGALIFDVNVGGMIFFDDNRGGMEFLTLEISPSKPERGVKLMGCRMFKELKDGV